MSFKHLLGQEVIGNPEVKPGNYTLEFMWQPPLTKVLEHNVKEGIYTRWYYDIGDEVRELNGYMEKCGYNIYNEQRNKKQLYTIKGMQLLFTML